MEEVISLYDQMDGKITLPFPPKKIISLVPSQTELLFYLGLSREIVGITKFCVHPKEHVKEIPKIGGTKKFNFERIATLKPSLIIGNKEENYKEGILELAKDFPVYVSDIFSLADAYRMMEDVGKMIGKPKEASLLVDTIKSSFSSLNIIKKRRALYLIWKNPYMSVGNNTFIDHMLGYAGFVNALHEKARYPIITEEKIVFLNPDYVLLSSEPYPFKEKHVKEIQALLPNAKILLVDGELFSWYGSRLLYSAPYFKQLEKL